MKVDGPGWRGTRTERFEETARFFREVMGVEETRREPDVVGLAFPDGTGMEAAGVEFLGPVQRSEEAVWSHFRGRDGNVYEIVTRR